MYKGNMNEFIAEVSKYVMDKYPALTMGLVFVISQKTLDATPYLKRYYPSTHALLLREVDDVGPYSIHDHFFLKDDEEFEEDVYEYINDRLEELGYV